MVDLSVNHLSGVSKYPVPSQHQKPLIYYGAFGGDAVLESKI